MQNINASIKKHNIDEREAEFHKIIYEWNKTDKEFSTVRTINTLFENTVAETPNKIAIAIGSKQLTYSELEDRANRLAHYLIKNCAVTPKTNIVLCLDRNENILISILAILKCGAAYVPLDPSYPDDRVRYILEDTKTSVLLTNSASTERFKGIISNISVDAHICPLDDIDFQTNLDNQVSSSPEININENDLAYIIYTSGTTGSPKGVMIEHRSIINYIYNVKEHIQIDSNDVVDFSTNIGFDLTVTTTICSLCLGAKIAICKSELLDLDEYRKHLIENKVTVVKLVPSYFKLMVEFLPDTRLRKVILGGEKLDLSILRAISELSYQGKLSDHPKVFDEYGPTETTVGACISTVYPSSAPNIGRPYNNYKMYVLDEHLSPCRRGEQGELYIGGIGVARGYLNQQALSEAKFILNPFQTNDEKMTGNNNRIYKTGDLVRWLEDGNLEYIGRSDFQVKIRGYRIELEEIESALQSHFDVFQAVVNVLKNAAGEATIIGYVVPGDFTPSETELKEFLSMKLPEYMVPSSIFYLKQLPLTLNGKVDKDALPLPNFEDSDYVAPRNELETQLCTLLADVFKLPAEKVGIREDFFKMGGDSILAIQFVSKVRHRLNIKITVKDIFEYKSIERLCDERLGNIVAISGMQDIKREAGKLSGDFPLLPIQQWFCESKFKDPNHFNQAFILKTPPLNRDKLKNSILKLIDYHDAFRMRFSKEKGNFLKAYYDPSLPAEEVKFLNIQSLPSDCFSEELHRTLTHWQSNFNLEHGPTYCFGYLDGFSDGSARVFVSLHHMIVDAVSWRIISEDLKQLYEGNELPFKGSSYRQWAHALEHYAKINEKEKDYWRKVMADYDESALQKQFIITKDFINREVELSSEHTMNLLRRANDAYKTQVNDILLTAFAYAIKELTGHETNHIILEGHGREEIDPTIDISRTIGWFTSFFPIRLKVQRDLQTTIMTIKESLRGVPNKGVVYGSLFGLSPKSMPKIRFNYLGQFEGSSSLESSFIENKNKDHDVWPFSNEGVGLSVSLGNVEHNLININGIITKGKLKLYVDTKLGTELTNKLGTSLRENLEKIIDFTTKNTKKSLTSSDIDHIVTQETLDKLQQVREIESVFYANSLQKGFYSYAITQGEDDDAYHVQMVWKYESKIDPDVLKRSWALAQQRLGCLRLRFSWEEELMQIIDRTGELDWRYLDYSKVKDFETEISKLLKSDRLSTFKLNQGNLFRVYLIKCGENQYTCIFSSHHAILDGWGITVLLRYLHETYLKLLDGNKIESQTDFTYEESQKFLQKHIGEHDAFWKNYIAQIEDRAELSFLLPNGRLNTGEAIKECRKLKAPTEAHLYINNTLYDKLKNISKEEAITLGAMLQFVWHKVLHIYSASHQTIVGTVFAGRDIPIANIESSVGLHINTLPFIIDHREQTNGSVLDIIRHIQKINNDLSEKSNVDLSSIQAGRTRLFDSLFIYENFPNPSKEEYNDRLNITFEDSIEKLDYPLAVVVYEKGSNLIFKLKYEGALFDKERVQQVLNTVEVLLNQIATNPSVSLSKLSYLTEKQHHTLLSEWNSIDASYPQLSIPQVFEKQVKETPENIAIVCGKNQLTYSELNNKANQLAYYLRELHFIKPESLVLLCLERDEHILISLIGVLKSGGGFVPIDPTYPDDRIKHILEDTQAHVLITNEEHKKRLQIIIDQTSNNTSIISIDNKETQQALIQYKSIDFPLMSQKKDLAYIMYTSGTTGKPKGVMIEQESFVAFIDHMKKTFFPSIKNVSTYSLTNYIFDIFGMEYGLPLFTGGYVEIGNTDVRSLNCSHYDFIQMTPSVCEVLLDSLNKVENTLLFIGGEKLSLELKNRLLEKSARFVNVYGPTETTIWSTSKSYGTENSPRDIDAVIGKPLSNEKVYVLDKNLTLLPPGAIGELYIGGIGLARGYLNNPSLTHEKFPDNPFQTLPNNKDNRLYKTGDLVRWSTNGELEYIGRNDLQIKIRGHRLELGEIEAALNNFKEIKQSVVIASLVKQAGDGNVNLLAYYVADKSIDESRIAAHLSESLPNYMMPSAYIHLYRLPLTPNGKLDRHALPEPQIQHLAQNSHITPSNETERTVRKIWSECLNISEDSISINDDFLGLGGSSILAIKLFNKLESVMPKEMPASSILKYPTIQKFSAYIQSYDGSQDDQGELYVL